MDKTSDVSLAKNKLGRLGRPHTVFFAVVPRHILVLYTIFFVGQIEEGIDFAGSEKDKLYV